MKNFNCTETGLKIERLYTSSDQVSHACAHKLRLHNFISLSLQKERQTAIEVSDDSNICKRLFPTNVSLSDRSPQTTYTSDNNSTAVKFNDNISEVNF